MDVIFSYPSCLLFLFFLPDLACSFPNRLPCLPPSVEIRHPFTSVSSANNSIQCIGSKPMIQFNNQGPRYVVLYLSYDSHTLIIQDQNLTSVLQGSHCDFVYVFEDPYPRFDPALCVQRLGSKPTIFNCNPNDYNFSGEVFDHFTGCSNYTIRYSHGSANQTHDDLLDFCLASQTPSFELKLSFKEEDFALLSAGSIQKWEHHSYCFDCQIKRENCSTDLMTGNPMCTCGSRCPPTRGKGKGKAIAIGVGVGVASLLAGCCCFLLYQRRKRGRRSTSSNLLVHSTSSKTFSMKDPESGSIIYRTHVFSYEELQAATNGFDASKELGDGGFGTVYKGELRDGRVVAVKRLYENNYKRVEQFVNEVDILSRLRHQNLVTLYGCTSRHSRELLLVYEFVPNGTVADHLHGPRAPEGGLTWGIRLNIAIETADALAYLHAVEPQIIHRDVKTNNILLDNSFRVKVADFGLSRLFPVHATHVSTLPQGTPGYVDPEYHQCYQLTDKSDVYSFGVVLVELISSKPAVDISRHRNEINLATMAITKIQQGELNQLVDPGLGSQEDWETERMITMVAELAFRCLQGDRDMRPCIKEVVGELRRIQGTGEKEVEAEIRTKEDMGLLKNTMPYSPDSVTARWESRLTTPNTSS